MWCKAASQVAPTQLSWHHDAMRPFVVIASLLIVVSIACSGYKSAGSQPAISNTQPQPATETNNARAQEKTLCTLTMAGAPDINGVKLGMTPAELLALFPGSQEDKEIRESLAMPPSEFGVSNLTIRSAQLASNEKFAEVNHITLILLDGRVSSFTVRYNGPEFSHVDKFVTKFIEGRNLPAVDQWEAFTGMDNQLKVLTCADFEVRVFAGGQGGNLNYVLMQDREADKKLKDRRRRAREQASPTPGQ